MHRNQALLIARDTLSFVKFRMHQVLQELNTKRPSAKKHSEYGTWDLKPYYLGAWAFALNPRPPSGTLTLNDPTIEPLMQPSKDPTIGYVDPLSLSS